MTDTPATTVKNATEKTEAKQRSLKNLKPFVKGQSGNPNGRPKGSVSVVDALKRKLEEYPVMKDGNTSKKTYLEMLVERYMKQTIEKGDTQLIRDLINRVDGMPKQFIDHTTDGEKLQGPMPYLPSKDNE